MVDWSERARKEGMGFLVEGIAHLRAKYGVNQIPGEDAEKMVAYVQELNRRSPNGGEQRGI